MKRIQYLLAAAVLTSLSVASPSSASKCMQELSDIRGKVEERRDSISEKCAQLKRDASNILERCQNEGSCQATHLMESALSDAILCLSELPFSPPSIHITDDCRSAAESLRSYDSKVTSAAQSFYDGVDSFKKCININLGK